MAKFKYSQNIESFIFDGDDVSLSINGKGTTAVWVDESSDVTITLKGKGFAAEEGNENLLGSGKIDSAVIKDGDNDLIVSATNLNAKAAGLTNAFELGGAQAIAFYLAKGDDKVTGSGQGDYIVGGSGDDVLTGKGGSDTFYFHAQQSSPELKVMAAEYDVITDFDVKGNNADRLAFDQDFDVKAQGQDTLLKFDDGSSLLLEGVKKAQFQDYLDTWVS